VRVLTIYPANTKTPLWLDLVDPTPEEQQRAEQALGAKLPTRQQTSALEQSSRFRSAEKLLRLNIPSFVRTESGQGMPTPLAFVVTPQLLVSVRYADSIAFDLVAKEMQSDTPPQDSIAVFVTLIEAIVNVGADHIEAISGNLSQLSQRVFADDGGQRKLLRGALFKIGRMQRQVTQIRAALLGVSRIVTFLCDGAPPFIGHDAHVRLRTVQADIASLTEFDQQLNDRLQFVLDAVLGFINNDQNDIMKVLTVITVVTVPPMILAGIWGMNFKTIPEYNWEHGYAFAWCAIITSMLVPLVWFKWKKWL